MCEDNFICDNCGETNSKEDMIQSNSGDYCSECDTPEERYSDRNNGMCHSDFI